MKSPNTHSKLTDAKLRALLKGLREEPAAPAGFRHQVLQRLAKEGLLRGAAPAPAPTLRGRLSRWMSPAGLGLAAAGVLALAVVLLNPRTAVVPPAAVAVSPAVQAPVQVPIHPAQVAVARRPVAQLAGRVAKPAAAPAQKDPEEEQSVEMAAVSAPAPVPASVPAAPAPAVGSLASAAPSTGTQVASSPESMSVAGADKPAVIAVAPTPVDKGMRVASQVRNNVVRASRGEQAIILFRVDQDGPVHVEIRDRLGRSVAVLKDSDMAPGQYQLQWAGGLDAGGMAASGIYQLTIRTATYESKHKLMLVK